MANASNNHHQGKNNQPRRKRNKKPVKRYSEEYSNRPNPYTGYSADGNYHPEAKKRPISDASAARAKAVEEERYAAINAAMTEAAWGPAQSPAPSPAQYPPQPTGYVPPTVTMPPPKWAASNNMTMQQIAAQEHSQPESAETASAAEESASKPESGSDAAQQTPGNGGGSHRKRKHRSKEDSARQRAAKTEAKRAAMDKIAKGVAAHSVTEQMIDDIASMSDVIENMPKAEKQANTNVGVNWEEFYDAAFPPKPQETTKFAGKKAKPTKKKRMDFSEELPEDAPMIVKPVMLGDDDLLPYDKIVKENEMEAAEAEQKANAVAEPEFRSGTAEPHETDDTSAAQKPEISGESVSELPPMPDISDAPDSEPLEDIAEVVGSISIEDILAAVQQEKAESVRSFDAVKEGTEFAVGSAFSFEADADEGWNEIIPPRAESQETQQASDSDSGSLLSERLMQSYIEAGEQTDEDMAPSDEEDTEQEIIEMVDLNQFLQGDGQKQDESAGEIASDDSDEITVDFVPEVIIDSAELDKESAAAQDDQAGEPDEEAQAVAQTAREAEAVVEIAQETEAPSEREVEVIVSDLEEDIFAETKVAQPEADTESGDTVQNKIDKLAEAAELAEVFRQENEDILPDDQKSSDESGVFSVSIDDIAVTPEVKVPASDEEGVREYLPREKDKEKDENVFESVLIVDENPAIVNPEASKGQDQTLFLHSREHNENPTAVFKIPEGPIVLPTDIDDAEFQEQWLDEDEDGDDMASRNKRTRRRISAFIGAVVLLFAVMILFSAVKTVISGFTNIGSTSEKKTEYTEFISPVVLTDPIPFESVEKADNNTLLQSSIWRALRELDETEGYELISDATNKIVLPAENVEKAAKELYGSDVQINMNVLSESDGSAIYYYDSIDNSFHITRSGIIGPTAVITKIAQKSDYISLVVGYSSQEEMSLTSSESSENECYKFMEYVLAIKPNGDYYIKSIRNYVED